MTRGEESRDNAHVMAGQIRTSRQQYGFCLAKPEVITDERARYAFGLSCVAHALKATLIDEICDTDLASNLPNLGHHYCSSRPSQSWRCGAGDDHSGADRCWRAKPDRAYRLAALGRRGGQPRW
jgi:hypothetical protein